MSEKSLANIPLSRLGGSCELHHDSWGYLDGVEVPNDRSHIVSRGDYIATFMAWLDEVRAGGATAFTSHGFEDRIVSS